MTTTDTITPLDALTILNPEFGAEVHEAFADVTRLKKAARRAYADAWEGRVTTETVGRLTFERDEALRQGNEKLTASVPAMTDLRALHALAAAYAAAARDARAAADLITQLRNEKRVLNNLVANLRADHGRLEANADRATKNADHFVELAEQRGAENAALVQQLADVTAQLAGANGLVRDQADLVTVERQQGDEMKEARNRTRVLYHSALREVERFKELAEDTEQSRQALYHEVERLRALCGTGRA